MDSPNDLGSLVLRLRGTSLSRLQPPANGHAGSPVKHTLPEGSTDSPGTQENSPGPITPQSASPRLASALKKHQTSGPRDPSNPLDEASLASHHAQSVLDTEPANAPEVLAAIGKSVQFQGGIQDRDIEEATPQQPASDGKKSEVQYKPNSLLSKLRAITTSQAHTHTRTTSAPPATDRAAGPRDFDTSLMPRPGRGEAAFSMMLEEDDSEANADAETEESAAEGGLKPPGYRKRRKIDHRPDGIETAPNSPMHLGLIAHHVTSDGISSRPPTLLRSATDTDLAARAHTSEDEGRTKVTGSESPWKWKRSRRNVSYGGERQLDESSPDGKRPTTLRNLATIASHLGSTRADEPETPRTSKRRGMGERGTTFGAQKWKEMRQRMRLLGQGRKKERTVDHEKSAELLAELAAGGPAALMLASMFQRDEHGNKRIPVILEQLKVSITDSEWEKGKESEKSDKSNLSDRHLIFRIELEYGNGINRMKWVVKRSLYDFVNLHVKYKFFYKTGKFKSTSADGKKMPKFPKKAFPYAKGLRMMDDEEDEEDEQGHDTDGGLSDTDPATPKQRRRPSYGFARGKSSGAGMSGANNTAMGAPMTPGTVAHTTFTRRVGFDEMRRKKLEIYIQRMIKFMLFRPEANRLCKFLEVSALGMRLAAEGSYHGKEGYLVIQSAKGLDFRKALTPSNVKGRHTPKWFLVRHSYVVCVDSPEEMNIYDVFLFDSDFTISPSAKQQRRRAQNTKEKYHTAKESAKHPKHHRLKLQNSERRLKLVARNERQLLQFEESIQSVVDHSTWARKNRFDSFAPVRPNCFAQWLVDGRDHMWVVSRAISQAKDVIYIHDWWLSPELYMRRPPAISGKWRLDRLLQRKAKEGVKIFVIVYRNIESAIPIDSQYTKFSLLDLHENVFVQRSPNQFRQNTFFWAHHEKLCIVDHTLAFVGGIDLCFGRWDTPQHTVADDKPTGFENDNVPKDSDHIQLWPGKDYSNPRVQDFYALNKPYEEMYQRSQIARMPWHDVSMQVVGQPARDLTRHFVQRWNYILRQRKPTRPTPFLLPPPDFNPADLEALGLDGTCEVQILRSSGPWSMGTPDKTEHSIMNAYVKMIEESQHFVYLENQFFISSCETEQTTIHNLIGDALVERILRAHKNSEAWRAVAVIPLIPGFQNTVDQEGGTSVRLIMQYQYRSICRGESSIFGRLKAQGIEPTDYIDFYGLRTWGKIGPKKALVTEQLYIHAKCMIVDDRVAIIGSANINERSMLGNRDSECAAVVRDTDMVWSRMNGEPYQVGRFPHTLRMRLMREHLGLDVDQIMEDAQILQSEHVKNNATQTSASVVASPVEHDEGRPISPVMTEASHADTLDRTITDRAFSTRDDLLNRNDVLRSFNHDVDWEQADNPNLRANRRVTEDPRVTNNEVHRKDVEGQGFDNMSELDSAGYNVGRDTTLVSGNKEVLVSHLDPEGRSSVQHPRQHGETLRRPSYIQSLELPHPPMPPRPALGERMSTAALGLPMVSQLPELPETDDTDIGGPALSKTFSQQSTSHHPLLSELTHPAVDRDCMQDPLHEAFVFDTWHEIAENNTKVYRAVFRCMPDNNVRDWKEYHEYVAYEQRFNRMQGLGPPGSSMGDNGVGASPGRKHGPSVSRSGPPGVGMKAPGAEIKAVVGRGQNLGLIAKEKIEQTLSGAAGESHKFSAEQVNIEDEKLGEWAEEMNRKQLERQNSVSPTEFGAATSPFNEKVGLDTVPEHGDQSQDAVADSPTTVSSPLPPLSTSNTVDDTPTARYSTEGSATAVGAKATHPLFVGYSEALNMNAHSNSHRRRRRATTRGSRGGWGGAFNAADDLPSVEEAQELLDCVQGHLVLWPYEWLEKVEAGGNWLYPLDQISPIEIYV